MRLLEICLLAIFCLCSVTYAGEPIIIYQGTQGSPPKQPQAFVSTDGTVHLTFGVGDKVHYTSNAKGTFDSSSIAFNVPNLSLGMRRGPRIAATKNAIVITAIGGVQGKGKDGDVQAYRSDDQGKTWMEPTRVNDVAASAREGLHALTVTDAGVLWCVWLDLRSNKTELYASKSSDGGNTWSKNQMVYRSPDGSVCECCHPSIAAHGNSIHVLFRNSLAGNRDMYLVSSDDNGETFGGAIRLGVQSWELNACPMDGGMLAIAPSSEVVTAWRRKGTIFTTDAKAKLETNVGDGQQPWITANQKGSYVAWIENPSGTLMVKLPGAAEAIPLTSNARDPIIVSGGVDSPLVHVFWEQHSPDPFSIMCKTLE
jgi:hypothetical protein